MLQEYANSTGHEGEKKRDHPRFQQEEWFIYRGGLLPGRREAAVKSLHDLLDHHVQGGRKDCVVSKDAERKRKDLSFAMESPHRSTFGDYGVKYRKCSTEKRLPGKKKKTVEDSRRGRSLKKIRLWKVDSETKRGNAQ